MKRRGRPTEKENKEDKDHRVNNSTGEDQQNKKKEEAKNNKSGSPAAVPLDDESENQGFGMWLRSSDGVEMMRLFVLANSVLVFMTMAWPNMQQAITIIKEFIMGEDEE